MKGCALQKNKAPANKNTSLLLSSFPAAPADSAAGFCHPELIKKPASAPGPAEPPGWPAALQPGNPLRKIDLALSPSKQMT